MSIKDDENGKELKQPYYDEDKDQLEEKQQEETGELRKQPIKCFEVLNI